MIKYSRIFIILFIIPSIISVNQWTRIPVSSTTFNWVIYFLFSILLFSYTKNFKRKSPNYDDYKYLKWFIVWVLICFFRGVFIAENYWDFKSLVTNSFAFLIATSVYAFNNPALVALVYRNWLKCAPFLFLLLIPILDPSAYGFFLVPISVLALFLPCLSNKLKIIVIIGTIIVVVSDLDARSNVIKFTIPFLFSSFLLLPKIINNKSFRKATITIAFLIPFLFLGLAASGTFNIFKMDEYIGGEYKQKKMIDGELREVNLKADTRTFLYEEVIYSSIKYNYFLFGRTPARGNASASFGSHAAVELGTGRYERYSNEVSILNIFTWTGLLGVFLYFLIFLKLCIWLYLGLIINLR